MPNAEVTLINIMDFVLQKLKVCERREKMGGGTKYDKFMLKGITREAISTS